MTTGSGDPELQALRLAFLRRDDADLVGLPEGHHLDAKRQSYRLDDPVQKFELAKDVSGLANASGGLILIPATTRAEPEGEVIDELRDLDLALIDTQRIRNVVSEWVHPAIAGLEVRVVETREGRGRLMIYVPPQDQSSWPHVITRAEFDGRIESRGVAVCVRHGPDVRALGAAEIQSLLAAGHRARLLADRHEEADGPRFQPKTGHGTGTFNLHLPAGPLNAHLVNAGGTDALVDGAVLQTPVGDFDGVMFVQDGRSTSALPQGTARVPRNGHLVVQFGDGHLAALPQAGGHLELSLVYRRPDRQARSEYRVQLLRAGGGVTERPQWRAGEESTLQLGVPKS